MSKPETQKRLIRGTVVSTGMDKTIVVMLVRKVAHSLYGKFVKRYRKFHVHDENNLAKKGDVVTFIPSRPRSKLKHWELVAVVEAATEV